MAKGLFEKARKSATPKTTKAKDEYVRVKIEDSSFFDKVEKLESLQDRMKSDKAKADMISDELREIAKDEWSKLYEKTGKNPNTIMLEHVNSVDDTAQLMFSPSDRYISINEERAESLREEFGEDIVEEKTTYSFDNDMIEKYGEIISELIENSTKINEKDKEKIIKAVTTFAVAKGTIDKLKTYGEVEKMVEAVRPVVALKNIEIVKG